jgi:flagellar basal body-associated protein FliL
MAFRFLKNLLFPEQAEWQQRKQMKIILWVAVVALICAAIMGALMLFFNSQKPH